MKFILIPLLVLFLAGVYVLLKTTAQHNKNNCSNKTAAKLVIHVKDQELWVEGFIRRLFRHLKSSTGVDILVVDDGSRDGTAEVLRCLQKYYPFKLLSGGSCTKELAAGRLAAEETVTGALYFDVRGFRGKTLLRTPLFSHLSHFHEGKNRALSK